MLFLAAVTGIVGIAAFVRLVCAAAFSQPYLVVQGPGNKARGAGQIFNAPAHKAAEGGIPLECTSL